MGNGLVAATALRSKRREVVVGADVLVRRPRKVAPGIGERTRPPSRFQELVRLRFPLELTPERDPPSAARPPPHGTFVEPWEL